MKLVINGGGRNKYFKGSCGDCVTRAICNATGLDYKKVYDDLNELTKNDKKLIKQGRNNKSVRNGTNTRILKKYINDVLHLKWVATMGIGTGCKVHLNENELPKDKTLIVNVSKHLTCVKNGVLYDTYDCSRGGKRCVYGYWIVE